MTLYAIEAYNGYVVRPKQRRDYRTIEAENPANAVRQFLDTLTFDEIGPLGVRVYQVYDLTNHHIVEAKELTTVLKTFDVIGGRLAHNGEPL